MDKIKNNKMELRWVPVGQLAENPNNWRLHPEKQVNALESALSSLGWAAALVYNSRTKRLIDGHARRNLVLEKSGPDTSVPVLVIDVSEDEEKTILATIDPIGEMATRDRSKLAELIGEIKGSGESLDDLVKSCHATTLQYMGLDRLPIPETIEESSVSRRVVVLCETEEEQKVIWERLTGEGLKCVLMS